MPSDEVSKELNKLKALLNAAHTYLSLSRVIAIEIGNINLSAELEKIIDEYYQLIKEIP